MISYENSGHLKDLFDRFHTGSRRHANKVLTGAIQKMTQVELKQTVNLLIDYMYHFQKTKREFVDATSVSSAISKCVKFGMFENAVQLFKALQSCDMAIDEVTLQSTIRAAVRSRNLPFVLYLLDFSQAKFGARTVSLLNVAIETIKFVDRYSSTYDTNEGHLEAMTAMRLLQDWAKLYNFYSHALTLDSFLLVACKFGCDEDCSQAFHAIQSYGFRPSLRAFGILLNRYAETGQESAAKEHLKLMDAAGIPLDAVAYNTLLKLCVNTRNHSWASEIVAEMKGKSIPFDQYTAGALLRLQQQKPFSQAISKRNVEQNNIFMDLQSSSLPIAAYSPYLYCNLINATENTARALELLLEAETAGSVDYAVYLAAATVHLRQNQHLGAMSIFQRMLNRGYELNRKSVSFLLKLCTAGLAFHDCLLQQHPSTLPAGEETNSLQNKAVAESESDTGNFAEACKQALVEIFEVINSSFAHCVDHMMIRRLSRSLIDLRSDPIHTVYMHRTFFPQYHVPAAQRRSLFISLDDALKTAKHQRQPQDLPIGLQRSDPAKTKNYLPQYFFNQKNIITSFSPILVEFIRQQCQTFLDNNEDTNNLHESHADSAARRPFTIHQLQVALQWMIFEGYDVGIKYIFDLLRGAIIFKPTTLKEDSSLLSFPSQSTLKSSSSLVEISPSSIHLNPLHSIQDRQSSPPSHPSRSMLNSSYDEDLRRSWVWRPTGTILFELCRYFRTKNYVSGSQNLMQWMSRDKKMLAPRTIINAIIAHLYREGEKEAAVRLFQLYQNNHEKDIARVYWSRDKYDQSPALDLHYLSRGMTYVLLLASFNQIRQQGLFQEHRNLKIITGKNLARSSLVDVVDGGYTRIRSRTAGNTDIPLNEIGAFDDSGDITAYRLSDEVQQILIEDFFPPIPSSTEPGNPGRIIVQLADILQN